MLKQKTVYFREEDLPLWEAIENKAEWLHMCLNDTQKIRNAAANMQNDALRLGMTPTPISQKEPDTIEIVDKVKEPFKINLPIERLSNGVCKIHGTPLDDRKKCLQKGCKYA